MQVLSSNERIHDIHIHDVNFSSKANKESSGKKYKQILFIIATGTFSFHRKDLRNHMNMTI